MSDVLKDFIQKNQEEFKEKPSDDVWKKIDVTLKQENIIYKPKNISTMLKYGFGASVIIAGTFIIMNLQKEKTEKTQLIRKTITKTSVTTNANLNTNSITVTLMPAKKIKTINGLKKFSDILTQEPTDTAKEIIITKNNPDVLYAAHPPVLDTLDITNWPSGGNQQKKYSLSGDNSTGKTIGCIKSVSKKVNGFITMMQNNVPDKYLGKRIRVTGYIRTVNVAEWAGIWLRVGAKGSDKALAFDNMRFGKKDRSVKGTSERTKYEVVLDVPPNAANIIYGVMLTGTGQLYFDSFILETVDNSVPVTGGNPDELNLSKTEKDKSYAPRNFWKWYVRGHKVSKDGTWNIDLEPNNF